MHSASHLDALLETDLSECCFSQKTEIKKEKFSLGYNTIFSLFYQIHFSRKSIEDKSGLFCEACSLCPTVRFQNDSGLTSYTPTLAILTAVKDL